MIKDTDETQIFKIIVKKDGGSSITTPIISIENNMVTANIAYFQEGMALSKMEEYILSKISNGENINNDDTNRTTNKFLKITQTKTQ